MCKNLLQGVRTMLRRNTPQRSGLRGVRTTYELVKAQAVILKLGKFTKTENFGISYLTIWFSETEWPKLTKSKRQAKIFVQQLRRNKFDETIEYKVKFLCLLQQNNLDELRISIEVK